MKSNVFNPDTSLWIFCIHCSGKRWGTCVDDLSGVAIGVIPVFATRHAFPFKAFETNFNGIIASPFPNETYPRCQVGEKKQQDLLQTIIFCGKSLTNSFREKTPILNFLCVCYLIQSFFVRKLSKIDNSCSRFITVQTNGSFSLPVICKIFLLWPFLFAFEYIKVVLSCLLFLFPTPQNAREKNFIFYFLFSHDFWRSVEFNENQLNSGFSCS